MITAFLILHALIGVALLGAITHQMVSALRHGSARGRSFIDRYTSVNQRAFTTAVVVLYVTNVILGAIILYPPYRLDVRIPFQEMGLGWAIGIFELKEHFAGIGLSLLPLYLWLWKPEMADSHRSGRIATTGMITFIVWWDFIIGHVLNNIRGFG
jgi:hypothetical protein